ncbi:MAG: N,N-dimethylformamidase beta subunit family domain-containing protein [Candidatus Elarobacter sp.]
MIRAYPQEPTVDAGGRLVLHVATDAPAFRVRIERWSDRAQTVLEAGPFDGREAPPGAPELPWDWPSIELDLPRDAAPGAYIARFLPAGGTAGRGAPRDDTPDARWGTAMFVVRAPSAARVVLNLPLFTYHAYNGAHVDGTRGFAEGTSLYSGQRSVTLRRPGGGTGGHPWDEVNSDVYDRTTPRQTFAHWDLYALAWFAREGIAVDVCTDLDLHRGSVDFDRYAALCTFGHDGYWTPEKRAHVEQWVDAGGNLAIFGGNTCRFRVLYDDATASITRDGKWSDDEPEDALTGLSFRAGGGKWIGPRPAAGYRIECSAHPLFRDAHVRDGDLVGAGASLIGYQCDGIDPQHAPENLVVLGRATFEGWNVGDGTGEIAPGGHAAMVAFERGDGLVFNAGTTDWARALGWGDARVKAITRSVVRGLVERGRG